MTSTPSYIQFEPGDFVRLPAEPDWGIGQVQSAVGQRITVNFDHAGKQVIHTDFAQLIHADRNP
ncbi:MAG: hypothetical protein CBC12_05045 [Candidatus Puniceispirillum sp. TMED52]|nr:DUF3553 domain-containing protein [SAR116 cluster bacterium]OUU50842.1 MAG: hypothetical protein CBC12_05045 [Candidatus Puniceispirillum sp. TMED52]|tara:strand:- start:523 stop:714 length:192 start_codon:yes stop_codon:yes gene_type:complete